MYLTRKRYIGANYEHNKVKGTIEIKKGNKKIPVDFTKVSYIDEAVGYWRKANQIHKWFVDNVQEGVDDCKEYYVSVEKLKELLDICKEVKAKAKLKKGKIENGKHIENGQWITDYIDGKYIENDAEIEAILPTTSGFFFGGTGYDQWYMNDIDNTIHILEEILKEEKKDNKRHIYNEYYYQSSW